MAVDASWVAWGRLLRARASMPPAAWAALWQRLVAGGAAAGLSNQPASLTEQALAALARGGSNSVAVAAGRSGGAGALIASDPHLAIGLPNPCLIAGLHSPQTQAVGLMMPGIPFMPVGRNRWIAWGGTNLYAQTSDLFDLAGLPAGQISTRHETIKVRGGGTRTLRLRRCPLGPIVSDGRMLRHDRPLALRWIGHQPTDELSAMLGVARARNFDEFSRAVEGIAVPGLNLTFAGVDGRVGQLLATHVPRQRRSLGHDLVVPWRQPWDPADRLTSADLPVRCDPAAGYVASANDRPPAGAEGVGLFYAPDDRIARLRLLLGGGGPITPGDLAALQQDVDHAPALPLRDLLLAGLGKAPRPAPQQRIVALLAQWDGCYGAESAGATAFEFLLARTVFTLWKRSALSPYDAVRRARPLIQADLEALPPEILARALDKALARLARRWPRDPRWGQVHRLRLRHALGALPRIGKYFGAPDIPAAGCNDTVNKAAHGLSDKAHWAGFGAAARHISDLGDPDANQFLLLGGQDGWFGSANFADQVARWAGGTYITVPLRLEAAQAGFGHKTTFRPA
ncbi:penicillin acylase family protein [Oleomonas cavernae]|uniref:Penicillin acylase family protein n=1 Tax=Oleomonas cavernae TaxID=2320859 RepID=A0A418WE56_9PROT|nr:penicillin acylase family protein [Oleomonas cavernae]